MTPSLCRNTLGLQPHEPVKKINRNESVGEKYLVLRPHIQTLQYLGEEGRRVTSASLWSDPVS